MLEKILGALLPAVITILLGYFAARHHDFEQKEVPTLNRMVMGYALPLSLFVGVVSAGRAELLADMPLAIVLSIAIIGMYWAIFLLARFGFHYSASLSALGALTASAPSTAFIGSAVLGYLYGVKADIPVAVGSIIIVVALVPVTIIILSLETTGQPVHRRKAQVQSPPPDPDVAGKIMDALKQPVVWLPLLGFIVVLMDVEVPHVAENSLSLLGHASAGVALFSSGIILAGYKVVVNGPVLFLVFVKNVVQPALVLGAMLWFGYTDPILGEAVLTTALPPVALIVMLGVQYNVAAREAASALFLSTMASLITMSAFIWFLL
jgi:predicted permease